MEKYLENISSDIVIRLLGDAYNTNSKYYMINDPFKTILLEINSEGEEIEHLLKLDNEVTSLSSEDRNVEERSKLTKLDILENITMYCMFFLLFIVIFVCTKIFKN